MKRCYPQSDIARWSHRRISSHENEKRYVVTRGRVKNEKTFIFLVPWWPLNLLGWRLVGRGHHRQWSHGKKSHVTNKKSYISYMAHDYQTRQSDGLWYWVTTHRFVWFLIICGSSLMTNKKRYISNSTSPMNIKFDPMVAYDMGPPLKKSHHSLWKFLPQQCTFERKYSILNLMGDSL